ncbi:peptidylprolyl isomerase [Bacillus sp. DNRA2]|uniref:peptidylprolyl isomerase n=1 Tax=Bacillus sp. DNRA2 TaxID=2723053 RepID=UPI00145D075C|nr:peptidylprolyl isomerase [Bacillus sp. DNRA2]NMD69036.1 peptidylprolyl isomerase [Bacillus sp. DNRA2]
MKIRILFLVTTLIFLLAACGSNNNNADTNDKKTGNGTTNEAVDTKDDEAEDENREYPQLSSEVGEDEVLVDMETTMGLIKIKLFPKYAPKAVENFITHSKEGYYDGLIFHRVIKDFMIQGGDPTGTGRGGESIWKDNFEDEFSKSLYNLRGALSMANAGPGTNGSQFFIVQNSNLDDDTKDYIDANNYPQEIRDAYQKGGTPWLDNQHTVFGQVIQGMDVVDKIANVKTGSQDKPAEDVKINKITVKE